MREPADPMLERMLAATLAERAERVVPSVTADLVMARLDGRSRRATTRRRPHLLLGVAALLLVASAALLVAQQRDVTEAAAFTYHAVVERTLPGGSRAIIAVRPDGMERQLATVPPWRDTESRRHPATIISPEGWLAAATPRDWVFLDLRQPGRSFDPETLAAELGARGAWLDGRRFVTWGFDNGPITVVDLERGATSTLPWTKPQDIVAWARDGSAAVVSSDRRRIRGTTGAGIWVPVAGLDIGWRTGSWWRADGSELWICLDANVACPGDGGAEVAVRDPDGTLRAWATDASLPGERLVGAGLGPDAVWLVLMGREGGRHGTLARAVAPERIEPVAMWPLAATDPAGDITAVAPDGSLIVVAGAPSRLVDARSRGLIELDGTFIDLVPAAIADGWPGTAWAVPDPGARPAPRTLPDAGLPTADALAAEQTVIPGDRTLWRGGEDATSGDGSANVVEIGPLDLSDGLGIVVACDGPGDLQLVALEMDGSPAALGDTGEVRSRCLSPGDRGGGSRAVLQIDRPIRFRLTTTGDTAWRAVIYDPAPEPTDDATAP